MTAEDEVGHEDRAQPDMRQLESRVQRRGRYREVDGDLQVRYMLGSIRVGYRGKRHDGWTIDVGRGRRGG